EEKLFRIRAEPRGDDGLGPGSEVDDPRLAVMGGLVTGGAIFPDLRIGRQLAPAHLADLARPGARKSLQLDDGPYLAVHVGADGINVRVIDGADRLRFPDAAVAAGEATDGLEAMDHARGDELFRRGPLERPHDMPGALVDLAAQQIGVDY